MEQRRSVRILLVACAAVLLCGVSTASLVASAYALRAAPVLEKLKLRQGVSAREASDAARASYRASRWFESSRHLSETALAMSALGMAHQRQRLVDVPSLDEIVERALKESPVSPYNWARRAELLRSRGDLVSAQRAWKTSVYMGRYVPGLMEPRLEIGFTLLSLEQDPEFIDLLSSQIGLLAELNPQAVARLSDVYNAAPLVRLALRSDPPLNATIATLTEKSRTSRDSD